MAGRRWTKEEKEYLEDSWGLKKISTIAKNLNRTVISIKNMSIRLKLGRATESHGLFTAAEFARAVGVDTKTVVRIWIEKYKMPAQKRIVGKKRSYWQINIDLFWKWAEKNQDRLDSRKMEPLALGEEPSWMAEKREHDKKRPVREKKPWTKQEKEKAAWMYQKGKTQKEIAAALDRSYYGVIRKFSKGIW